MIVFLVSGLWHGASLSFVVWGGINGLYQVIGALISPLKNKIKAAYDLFDDYDNWTDFLWNIIIYHNRWDDINLREEFKVEKSPEMGSEYLVGNTDAYLDLIGPDEK